MDLRALNSKENMDDSAFYLQLKYSDCPGGNERRCFRPECWSSSLWQALPSRVRTLLCANDLLHFEREVDRHGPGSSGPDRRSTSPAGPGPRREMSLACG